MYALLGVVVPELLQGRQGEAVLAVTDVEVVVVEAAAVEEEGARVVEVQVVEEAEEELDAGICLPLIQVCALAAACLALALACSLSLSCFLSLSFWSFLSFSWVALLSSALAFLICSVCLSSFLLTSSWMARIPLPLVVWTGAAAGAGTRAAGTGMEGGAIVAAA